MSSIAEVRDIDCLKSLNPIRFDMGASSFVTGTDALLRRILYRWCALLGSVRHARDLGVPRPLLDLPGATFSPADLAGLRASLEKQARDEAFVSGASVTVTLADSGNLNVAAKIRFEDGRVEPLELLAGPARAVLLKLGGGAA